jgi:hypothetical protein
MKTGHLRWSCFFLVLLVAGRAWGAAEAAASGAPVVPTVPVTTLTELQAALEAQVSQPKFLGALWSVKVVSLDPGRTLYEHAPTRRMSPASNSKLYVGALALDALGGDFRIRTPLLGSVAVNAAGELLGDLIVSGRGDPSWDPRRAKQEFMAAFEPCIAVLKKAGVRRIAGDVVVGARVVGREFMATGGGRFLQQRRDGGKRVRVRRNHAALQIRGEGLRHCGGGFGFGVGGNGFGGRREEGENRHDADRKNPDRHHDFQQTESQATPRTARRLTIKS